jgi:HSP20 family protein
MRERQPLVDVFEEGDHFIVLAELPGIDENDVNIKADESYLTITAENATKRYLKIVRLPARVKKRTIKFTYKNNILQVRLRKLTNKKQI